MNKETFFNILEGSILSFQGVTELELIDHYEFNPKIAKVSSQLSDFLKSKDFDIK